MVMARHRFCCELRFQIRSSCSVGCFSEYDRAVFRSGILVAFPGIEYSLVYGIDSKSGLRNFYRWWKFEDLPYECQTTLLRIFHFSLSSEKNQSVRSLVVVSNLEVQANTRTVSMEKKKVRC